MMTARFATQAHGCEHDFGPELLAETLCLRACGTAYGEWSEENAHDGDVHPITERLPLTDEEPPESYPNEDLA
jgi:hypothetical protein